MVDVGDDREVADLALVHLARGDGTREAVFSGFRD
jgi:hypothetical protein